MSGGRGGRVTGLLLCKYQDSILYMLQTPSQVLQFPSNAPSDLKILRCGHGRGGKLKPWSARFLLGIGNAGDE